MKYVYIFIVSILFLIISSINQSFAAGFSGAGASGEWDEPDKCEPQYVYSIGGFTAATPSAAFDAWFSAQPWSTTHPLSYPWILKSTVQVGDNFSYTIQSKNYPNLTETYTVFRVVSDDYDPNCKDKCPAGYEAVNGKCQPKKCPVGQTLVNGKCVEKKCPAGQSLDKNGQCFAPDDSCPAGQKKVNGRCITPPPDDPDPNSEWPPFCEWASIMCQWHEEWQEWSNDYAANEEKANLDREEIKRLALDSKENLDDIKEKIDLTNDRIENANINNLQFYEDVREFLRNYDGSTDPTDEFPGLPAFCDWANIVCEWYIDWKVANIEHQQLMNDQITNDIDLAAKKMEQDQEFYAVMDKAASNVVGNQEKDLEQNKKFYDDVRDFFDWFKEQKEEQPENPNNNGGSVVEDQNFQPDSEQRVNWVAACPFAPKTDSIVIEGQTTNIPSDYSEMCNIAQQMRPIVLLAGAFISMLIIAMGLKR
ncbi:EB domain-containing protein [Acinetobacter sp. VNH17]|uniref:EB domain-containing protein n=1 Tax=Acinetobacter thutiue TaxID=2998078 RepID=A0ABT7WKG7_9GAMM|nr:EB domain-containing protein [Acinetobacter thutiue]MCY6411055.1 EB domain-containing protein [Acinetobacter thutiue]MDN0013157.1 EB domain-containing protein [Acinetobacter thutiue]